jgi:hypothetical protein
MKVFVITPHAREDIDIWYYIPDDSVKGVDRALDYLDTTMVRLAKNPGTGHWPQELAQFISAFSSIRT